MALFEIAKFVSFIGREGQVRFDPVSADPHLETAQKDHGAATARSSGRQGTIDAYRGEFVPLHFEIRPPPFQF
jgi:hypothetical protein